MRGDDARSFARRLRMLPLTIMSLSNQGTQGTKGNLTSPILPSSVPRLNTISPAYLAKVGILLLISITFTIKEKPTQPHIQERAEANDISNRGSKSTRFVVFRIENKRVSLGGIRPFGLPEANDL